MRDIIKIKERPQGALPSNTIPNPQEELKAITTRSDSSPTTDIDIINPILERFTDEPALFYSSPLGDDDVLFDFKSDNEEWKKLLYSDHFNDINFGKDKIKDSKIKILIDELESPKSNVLLPQLLNSDSTLPEESYESFEIATLLSSPFENEDRVFKPGILILGGTRILIMNQKIRI
uniref:Reverse transcriptase domain-containing protein n=1 Tax=Tanacetum cinerariifolium TaxID=118510 RepID=A0A6L2NU06_TANCI|nr:hypothetical protein [Tanacetum cinerariifolium]